MRHPDADGMRLGPEWCCEAAPFKLNNGRRYMCSLPVDHEGDHVSLIAGQLPVGSWERTPPPPQPKLLDRIANALLPWWLIWLTLDMTNDLLRWWLS